MKRIRDMINEVEVMTAEIDDRTAALAFANALSVLLQEREGVVVQAEVADGKMRKFIVFNEAKQIQIIAARPDMEVGVMVWMYEDEEEAQATAVANGEDFVSLEQDNIVNN